jgi:putative phosphoesterase
VLADASRCTTLASRERFVVTRLAVLSDVHGNRHALEAVRKAIKAAKPDAILVAGDLALNGPDPAATIDGIRELEAAGALVVQGNTDIAVADFDYTAAFPWLTEGVPDSFRAAAEWANEQLGDERLDWLRRLPAERRLPAGDVLVLVTHASPGSQTQGFDQALDASVVFERAARTDARVICCGHTHIPEVRDLGFKWIVNAGSAGYAFDGDPTASWAQVEIEGETIEAEIKRTLFDALAVSTAITERGLPGDVYRAATVRTGKLVR